MDSEKKLKLTTDSRSTEDAFDRIQKRAEEMGQKLMDYSARNAKSSKEMIDNYNEEIKAMERLQELASAGREIDARQSLARNPNNAEAKQELIDLKLDDKEFKLQTEMLKEIRDAIINQGQKEVEENKIAVEKTLSQTPHKYRTFKQRFQAGLLDQEELGGISEEERRSRGGGMGAMRGYGMSVIGARNAIDAGFNVAGETGGMMSTMGGGLAIAGISLALSTILGKKVLDTVTEYKKQINAAYATSGRDVTDKGLDYSKYGYSGTDFLAQLSPLSRARRSSEGVEESARYQMLLKRGINLDEGSYQSMDMLALLEGKSGIGNIQSSISAMRSAGIVKGGDMSAVPDYLAIMVNLGKEQVSRLGKVDMGINTKMVAALGNMDETLKKSPEALSTMVNAVRGGLSGGGTPQQQALQFSVLSKIAPGASMFELMEMREDPFSKKSQKYMPAYLEQLKKISGNNDDRFFMQIQQSFNGLSYSMARKLGTGYNNGSLNKVLNEDFSGKVGIEGLENRAERATTPVEKANAEATNLLISIADSVKKIGGDIAAVRVSQQRTADEITAKGGIGNRVIGAMVEQSIYRGFSH